jgi:hypothetical protein
MHYEIEKSFARDFQKLKDKKAGKCNPRVHPKSIRRPHDQ